MPHEQCQALAERPLVSLCVMSYNRRPFIRESLESAFAQTYSPLEIVISDDCSQDGAFEIIQSMAAAYRGPHTVIVNRNERNIGLIGNLNKLYSLARGELHFYHCDDDVSLPNRVEVMVDAWLRHGKAPMVLASAFQEMDLQGRDVAVRHPPANGILGLDCLSFLRSNNPVEAFSGSGAVLAYNRKVFDTFGPFTFTENVAEDWVMLVRARLLGDLLAVPDVLLKYRLGGGLTTDFSRYHKIMLRHFTCVGAAMQQLSLDIETIRPRLSDDVYAAFKREAESRADREERMVRLYSAPAFKDRLTAFRSLADAKLFVQPKALGLLTLALFPPAVSPRLMQAAYSLLSALKPKPRS